MIVTIQKPLDEILDSISPYTSILVAGCDGCTQPPRGLREAKSLAQLLELGGKLRGKDFAFKVTTVAKQCDSHLVDDIIRLQTEGVEAVLSLACGVGIQTMAEIFPRVPILPAQNTLFMGDEQREGQVLLERCLACGDCVLAESGGICPFTRCSKSLLNGPCGGSKNGKCEVDPERDCAWILIYNRLKERGKLDFLQQFHPARDFKVVPRSESVVA